MCVIDKTGIFKEAPGVLEEVFVVTKEVPKLLRGSVALTEVLEMFHGSAKIF